MRLTEVHLFSIGVVVVATIAIAIVGYIQLNRENSQEILDAQQAIPSIAAEPVVTADRAPANEPVVVVDSESATLPLQGSEQELSRTSEETAKEHGVTIVRGSDGTSDCMELDEETKNFISCSSAEAVAAKHSVTIVSGPRGTGGCFSTNDAGEPMPCPLSNESVDVRGIMIVRGGTDTGICFRLESGQSVKCSEAETVRRYKRMTSIY